MGHGKGGGGLRISVLPASTAAAAACPPRDAPFPSRRARVLAGRRPSSLQA